MFVRLIVGTFVLAYVRVYVRTSYGRLENAAERCEVQAKRGPSEARSVRTNIQEVVADDTIWTFLDADIQTVVVLRFLCKASTYVRA